MGTRDLGHHRGLVRQQLRDGWHRSNSGRSAASAIRHGRQQPQASSLAAWPLASLKLAAWPLTCLTGTKVHLMLWSLGIPGQLSCPWLPSWEDPHVVSNGACAQEARPQPSGGFCKMEVQGPGRPEDMAEEDTRDHKVSEFTRKILEANEHGQTAAPPGAPPVDALPSALASLVWWV